MSNKHPPQQTVSSPEAGAPEATILRGTSKATTPPLRGTPPYQEGSHKNSPPEKGEYPEGGRGLIPKLRFPEFWDAGEWGLHDLGSKTTKVGSGITPNGGEKVYRNSGRPFVRSQNVGWGTLLLDDVAFIDEETHQSFAGTEITNHDVLLNITGASIGRSALADDRIAGGNVNQHVCIIRTTKELNPSLLNQFLISHHGQRQIDSFQAGGNRQGLNFAQIRSFSIPLPIDEKEQQKIADCLSSLDALIAAQAEKIEAIKSHKKGLMQQLFPQDGETVPRLRFPEFRNAGVWEVNALGDMVDIRSGFSPSQYQLRGKGVYPFVKVEDLNNCVKYQSESREYSDDAKGLIPCNSIIFPKRGAAIALNKIRLSACEMLMDTNMMALTPFQGCHADFLFHLLSLVGLSQIADNSTIPQINNKHIVPFRVMVPQPEEQQKIADCLSFLDEAIAAGTEKLDALKTHKKGLMQQLFPAVENEAGS